VTGERIEGLPSFSESERFSFGCTVVVTTMATPPAAMSTVTVDNTTPSVMTETTQNKYSVYRSSNT